MTPITSAERYALGATSILREANELAAMIRGAGVAKGCRMDPQKKEEQHANERRRYEALRIIADLQQRKRHRQTNEMLLDQDALRQAAIRAGLEKSESDR